MRVDRPGSPRCLWRGGLPPLGSEAAPNHPFNSVRQTALAGFTTAAQPNGGKLARHRFRASRCQSTQHRHPL
ncbi:hypothetical protein C9I50_00560 [Pseudomonas prosekii]|nr:hypothetical protein C9I50_00560 [Pseudomonas prosekii]